MIEKKIKKNFGSKGKFAESIGISPKDLSSKLRTLRNKIEWINNFLNPIGLHVEIKNQKEKLKCDCCNGTGMVEGKHYDDLQRCNTCLGKGTF